MVAYSCHPYFLTPVFRACVPCRFSRVQLFVTLWTVALQTPLSMGFSRGVGCHVLLQRIFPTQGLNLGLSLSVVSAGGFFTTSATWEALLRTYFTTVWVSGLVTPSECQCLLRHHFPDSLLKSLADNPFRSHNSQLLINS